jgi:rhodanese-related sulfurtransferase
MATEDDYTIVDVRTIQERMQGHPPGSQHVVLDTIPTAMDSLNGTKVLAICRSGNRSGVAAKYLRNAGVEALNVKGGMIAWQRAGLPIRSGR